MKANMLHRGDIPPLRVSVPKLGNSPSLRLSRYHIAFSPSPTPTPVIHQRPHKGRLWIAVLLQLSSLYAAQQWLKGSAEPSVIKFAFLAFFGTSVVLGFLQKPWKGRAISSSQFFMLIMSGGLLGIAFLLRVRGLSEVGPLETILAEFAGAVVGKVLIKAQRKVHGIGDAKVRGSIGLLAGLYLLSQGWAVSSCSPLSSLLVPVTKTNKFSSARLTRSTRIGYTSESRAYLAGEDTASQTEKDCAKYVYIVFPIFAGLLSSVQKLLPTHTSLGSIPKKRLQALTYVAAGACFVPAAFLQLIFAKESGALDQTLLWPLFSVIAFGMVVAFYGDFFAEEKLLISPLSTYHFFVTVCSVCLLELIYGSDFSLLGFLVCSALIAIGVFAAAFISGGLDWHSISEKEYSGPSLVTMLKNPLYHIWTDVKTRKIAMFLLLNTSFMVVEFVYGFLSNSLGLISDACHMLFDCAALAIGLYASYISRLPPNSKFHFGYGRFEVLSGYANAVFLILVAALIVLESLERLLEPPEISTESLLVVSVGGFLVNVVGLLFFHEAHHHAHGSAPCTHVHSHDKAAPVASLKSGKGQMEIFSSQILAPKGFHEHAQFHGSSLDSPILNLQTSPPRVDGECSNQESHGAECNHDHSKLSSLNGVSFNGVQHANLINCEHSHGSVQLQVPKVQFAHQDSHSHSDQHPTAAQHAHGGEASHPIHDHRHKHNSQQASWGQSFEAHSNSHQQRGHFGGFVHDHQHTSPQHGASHESSPHSEHGHSVSCSHNHSYEQNPLVHQHQHSEACSHGCDQHKGQSLCLSGTHDMSNKLDYSGHNHGHNALAGVSGGLLHSNPNHHHEKGASFSDHAAGHAHTHRSPPLVHDDNGHQHGGHDIHEHGQSHNHGVHNHHRDHGVDHNDHPHCEGDHQDDHVGHHHHGDHDDHSDHHHHIDHNMEGIFLHILADTLGSVGVVISTLLIKYKGWLFTDPACSIFISVLIISSVLPLVRNTAELLLQRVPRSAEKRMKKALKKVEEVEGVHDWHKFHVWSYTNTELVGTLRLHVSIGTDKKIVRQKVSQILQEAGIIDLTLEVEDLENADDY